MLTLVGRCLFSLFLSLRSSFYFSLPSSCILSDDCICQFSFSFLTCCVRMRMKMEKCSFSFFSYSLFVSSCSYLKGKIFMLLFFFIYVIYMGALKDDARFDLFFIMILFVCIKQKTKIYIDDKSKK